MAIDLFASARQTALIALVTASFASPIVMKSDAVAGVQSRMSGGKDTGAQVEPTEQLVAGGVEFELPASWGRLGASAAAGERAATGRHASKASSIGTVVTALCPGGGAGGSCKDATQITFLAYSGEKGHSLPTLATFERELTTKLRKQSKGFKVVETKLRPGADGIRYLDYTFQFTAGGKVHQQRIAAFRHVDGSGVVAMAAGPKLHAHAKAIGAFLGSAHDPEVAAAE